MLVIRRFLVFSMSRMYRQQGTLQIERAHNEQSASTGSSVFFRLISTVAGGRDILVQYRSQGCRRQMRSVEVAEARGGTRGAPSARARLCVWLAVD